MAAEPNKLAGERPVGHPSGFFKLVLNFETLVSNSVIAFLRSTPHGRNCEPGFSDRRLQLCEAFDTDGRSGIENGIKSARFSGCLRKSSRLL